MCLGLGGAGWGEGFLELGEEGEGRGEEGCYLGHFGGWWFCRDAVGLFRGLWAVWEVGL